MKRYLLFAGDTYYPSGGWYDFIGSYSTVGEAQAQAQSDERHYDWAHVVDSQTGQVVSTSH